MNRVEVSKRLVLINSASSLATHALSISVLVWLQQFLLKRITAEEYSLLPIIYSIMMIAPLLTNILASGLSRYVVEAWARNDDSRVTQITSTMFPILCIGGIVLFSGGMAFAWNIDQFLKISPERVGDAQLMLGLLLFSAAIRLPIAPFSVGLFVRQKFVLQNLISVGREFLRIGVLFFLLMCFEARVIWVVAATFCADLVHLFVILSVSRKLVPALRFHASSLHWPVARELMSFGGWNFFAALASTIRTSADALILNRFATPVDLSSFHLGSLAMRHTQSTVIALRGTLTPSITALHATGATQRLGRVYLMGGRYGLWAVLIVVVPLIVFSREIFLLYIGPKFSQAAVVMALLLSTLPIAYGNMMMPQLAVATGRIRPWALSAAALQFTNLGLTFYFVAALKMGAIGSALATFLASLILHPCLMWPLGIKLSGVGWNVWLRKTLLPGMMPGLASSVFLCLCKWKFQPESWMSISVWVACATIVYTLVLGVFCLQVEDKSYGKQLWEKIQLRLGLIRRLKPT